MLLRPISIEPRLECPLWQSREWAATLRKLGRRAELEALGDVGQAMVISRRFGPFGTVRFTSAGPVWGEAATLEERIDALHNARLTVINALSDHPALRAAGYVRLPRPRQIAVLPIGTCKTTQLSFAHPKWRAAVMKGHSGQFTCETFDPERHAWIFEKDAAQQRAKGFRGLPHQLTKAFAATNPRSVHVCQFWTKLNAVAAMIFLRHGRSATYQIGWTSAEGRAQNAHHHTLLDMAQKLASQGVTAIDLGLYDPDRLPGLSRFKQRAGAKAIKLGGTWIKRPF